MVTYFVLVRTPLRLPVVVVGAVEVHENLVCEMVCPVYTVHEAVVT
jgi:hypothetical protein